MCEMTNLKSRDTKNNGKGKTNVKWLIRVVQVLPIQPSQAWHNSDSLGRSANIASAILARPIVGEAEICNRNV